MPTAQALWFRWSEGALLLHIATQPGAATSQVVGLHGGLLKIRIHAPPVDGKANRALVDFLAAAFATPRSRVSVLRGETSRSKTVRIDRPLHCPDELVALGLTPASIAPQ
jgi:uncharacterized protein